jgi:3-(3-hydroxy-phenyl)propionate hydroxylase
MTDQTVVVVGAGTIGLVTAVGLAQAGVSVRVLEAASTVTTAPRDMVYSWAALPGLGALGVLDEMTAVGLITDEWNFKIFETGESIEFALSGLGDEVEHPFNIHLGQDAMTRILLGRLERYSNAEIEWGVKVTTLAQDEHGVTVVAEGPDGARTYRADWVVGADGARSSVRRELGLAFAGLTWPERFVATNLRFDFSTVGFRSAAYQLDETYGAVIAQVDRSGLWRYTHAESRVLDEHTIPERLRPILEHVLPVGADPLVESAYPYRIHQRSADRFRVGRMLLVGDAAHLTNPILAYGMLSGLFDAFALVEALTAVVQLRAKQEVLDRYSEVRRRNFWEFTSPRSTEAKELIFPSGDSQRARDEWDRLREISTDKSRLRDYLRASAGCETPSLLQVAPADA